MFAVPRSGCGTSAALYPTAPLLLAIRQRSGRCADRRAANRLTAGGVASGLDAALKLIELLGSTELAQRVQQDTQYYPDPPVSSEIPPAPAECPIPADTLPDTSSLPTRFP